MFKKSVSYLVLSSFLLMDAASCMEPEKENPSLLPHSPRLLRNPPEFSPASSSTSPSVPLIFDPQERLQAISILPWDERNQLHAEFALQEDIPITLRREAFSSIRSTDSLDEATREGLRNLKATFLDDEELSLMERLAFLPNSDEKAPPVATLLSLMRSLEAEYRDSSDSDDEKIYDYRRGYCYRYDRYALYRFLVECPEPGVQQRLENHCFDHPLTTAFYLKEWVDDFYKKSEESQKTLILQKMQAAMQATNMTLRILVAAKFLLKHGQDHEPAVQALWKLVEKTTSNNSEESEEEKDGYEDYDKKIELIMVCKTLLKYAPTSPVRESVLSRLFSEAEQEFSPRALPTLLIQEEPSTSIRARELAEHRLDQNNLDYTLELFFSLEKKNLAQDLRQKIQERLKSKFNDSTDENISLSLAPVFLRATDENLSQKAFNYLKQDLINNGDPEDVETICQIIKAVGVDHPWAQEVINIGIEIGIEPSLFLNEVKTPSIIMAPPPLHPFRIFCKAS